MITSEKRRIITEADKESAINNFVSGDLEIIEEYITLLENRTRSESKSFSNAFFKLIYFLNEFDLIEINKNAVLEYISHLKSKGLANKTIRMNRVYLDNFFNTI